MAITQSNEFNQLIAQLQIAETAAEVHGFLSGLIAGGVQDESWKTLTYQFLNDGHAFSQAPLAALTDFYQQLTESFDEANTLFSLWTPSNEDGFALADAIAEWTSQFY
ncbi:yecA family protein [Actinobacillus equuli]|nr:yecA family protein [Actinobacillus equuli]